ncbi:type II toxin-antitoxin system VapC family toxin [Gracilimonas mengyeensis]|uniref:Predicted nucleic acid-binding protein, contains PIN domain n=1 Tax=Gracilimonas mengyeensis TaxID=1302730 RepID=A0A521ERT7_9BACT|nr:PIN domain-containing protein [Gracilimonas mengyeensis]SMO86625.1 Predicted nucleic acid-binding protein, contains PIN domain [Gracilimonas mengyeensis]
MSRGLIDTNIFVYGIDEDSKYFDQAKKILDQTDKQLVTTSKNLIEFLAVVTKSSGYNLNAELALEIIEEIIQSVEVIYPTPESMAILLDLVHRYSPSGLKIHDFEIISISLAHSIYEVATFNTKDFKSIQEISLSEI